MCVIFAVKADRCYRSDGEMILRAAEPEEYAEIGDVVSKAFKQSKIEHTIIKVTTLEDQNFWKGDLRVAEDDGKVVSTAMLIRRPLRIGIATVNCAIVGPVATDPDYQRKGYCSAVMRNAVQYMKTQGFDMTILWGIPWLYPHYGYSPAMVKTELVIKPKEDISIEKRPYEFRSFTESDLEQMTRIYHSNTATRTCAEVRSPKMWEWKPGGSEVKLEVLTDKKDEVIGYCALGTDWSGSPCAHEIGILNDEACVPIFNGLLGTAKKKGLKEFPCIVQPSHPFCRFAFWHGGEIRVQSGGGAGMARVLNLGSLLTKMCKEFERRLQYSEFHKLKGTLKISIMEEFALLEIDHGRVSVSTDNVAEEYQLDISLSCLNPLITGYKGIRELIKDPSVKVNGGNEALRLIEVLFPTGFPSGGLLPLFWE
jgi:predicted N-acetyltransferase YhbS